MSEAIAETNAPVAFATACCKKVSITFANSLYIRGPLRILRHHKGEGELNPRR
ncbi:MAG: hypothetical protein ABIJ61_07810 [bacterium]